MKPIIELARTTTPDGSVMILSQRDCDFHITVNREDLMNSRQHESELELARLGCHHLKSSRSPTVLIGGLGMGYTLRETLDLLRPEASVIVAEMMPDIVKWQRTHLSELNDSPLADPRVTVAKEDVLQVMKRSPHSFDAILLDVDNGPSAMTDSSNKDLYAKRGIRICQQALKPEGLLAVWSAAPDKSYEGRIQRENLAVMRYSAAPYKGSKSRHRFIFVAAARKDLMPPGGGELVEKARKGRKPRR